jgi:hypothetical protein
MTTSSNGKIIYLHTAGNTIDRTKPTIQPPSDDHAGRDMP